MTYRGRYRVIRVHPGSVALAFTSKHTAKSSEATEPTWVCYWQEVKPPEPPLLKPPTR